MVLQKEKGHRVLRNGNSLMMDDERERRELRWRLRWRMEIRNLGYESLKVPLPL